MDLFFPHSIRDYLRNNSWFCLAFTWILSLLCGAASAPSATAFFISELSGILSAPRSLTVYYGIQLLVLVFSAWAIGFGMTPVLFFLIFIKGFFHAFLGCCILWVCGSSGWLIRFLLHFGELVSLPVIWLFWLRSVHGSQDGMRWNLVFTACAVFLAFSLDYSVISPFLTNILFF